jgi:hypothetical protein
VRWFAPLRQRRRLVDSIPHTAASRSGPTRPARRSRPSRRVLRSAAHAVGNVLELSLECAPRLRSYPKQRRSRRFTFGPSRTTAFRVRISPCLRVRRIRRSEMYPPPCSPPSDIKLRCQPAITRHPAHSGGFAPNFCEIAASWRRSSLRTERDGAQGRDRTTDTVIFSHVLYQLSYLGVRIGTG